METFRNHAGFLEVETDQPFDQPQQGLIVVRSELLTRVYWRGEGEEILVGIGERPFEVDMPQGEFLVRSEGRVWLWQRARQQFTHASSDEVFTSLERPAPLTPEMQAIQRLVRANEIERERSRAQYEKLEEQLKRQEDAPIRGKRSGGQDSVVADDDPPAEKRKAKKPARSKAATPEPADEEDVDAEATFDPEGMPPHQNGERG